MHQPLHRETLKSVVDQSRYLWLIDVQQACCGHLWKPALAQDLIDRDCQTHFGLHLVRALQA
jgi:hypothetical protein